MNFENKPVKSLSQNERAEILKLWENSFGDKQDFINFMLDGALQEAEVFCAKQNDKLCSMLFLMDIEYKSEGALKTASYLYAAATAENFRARGIFSQLLNLATHFLKEKNKGTLLCKPASQSLFNFYEKLGFKNACFCKIYDIKQNNFGYNFTEESNYTKLYDLYLEEMAQTPKAVIKSKKQFCEAIDCAVFDKSSKVFTFDGGFLIAELSDNAKISYICSAYQNKQDVAQSFLYVKKKDGVFLDYSATPQKNALPYAMILDICDKNGCGIVCNLLFE